MDDKFIPPPQFNEHETPLNSHKRDGKKLIPPLLTVPKLERTSWMNDRLPDMIWACLIISNVDREEALNYFRHIASFVKDNNECFDITISGISNLPEKTRKSILKHFTSYSDNINNVLSSMMFFPSLPSYADWKECLQQYNEKNSVNYLQNAVARCAFHQSQEATDCRWVRILCMVVGNRLHFPSDLADVAKSIIQYPNYGDIHDLLPTIRAAEITFSANKEWASQFWDYCYEHTKCSICRADIDKIHKYQEKNSKTFEQTKKLYFAEYADVKNKICSHFMDTTTAVALPARHESAFGSTLYALTVVSEIVVYATEHSVLGRLGLRTLVEIYITFKYLLHKEKMEHTIWEDYRSHGSGQIKLINKNLRENKYAVPCIDLGVMDRFSNEDFIAEFVPVNLGHWDSVDLRKMAESVGLKDLYI